MDLEFTTMAVTDWSPEQGAKTARVEIPKDTWEAAQMVRGLRKVARARMGWTTGRISDLRERAERLLASPFVTPETRTAAIAALIRLTLVGSHSVQVGLRHRCRPRIRRFGEVDRIELLNKATLILEGHGWLMATETVLTSVEQLLDSPAETRTY